jgi:hypothetical protein
MDRKPLRRNEYLGVQDLIGGINSLHSAIGFLADRAKGAEVLDTLQEAHDTAIKAYKAILATIPAEKLVQIQRDLDHMRVYVRVEAPGIRTMDTDLWRYVPADRLNRLVDYVAQHECYFCDKSKQESKKCKFRKMMDDVLPHELEYTAPDGCCEWSGLVLGMEG